MKINGVTSSWEIQGQSWECTGKSMGYISMKQGMMIDWNTEIAQKWLRISSQSIKGTNQRSSVQCDELKEKEGYKIEKIALKISYLSLKGLKDVNHCFQGASFCCSNHDKNALSNKQNKLT